MSTINMLRTRDGTRCAWDREVACEIAAWLRMMYTRAERHLKVHTDGMESPVVCNHDGEPTALVARMRTINYLIKLVDDSWSLTAWESACEWVEQLLGVNHEHPETTTPESDAQCDSIRPEPGEGCSPGTDRHDAGD